jgi:hypothetical protein
MNFSKEELQTISNAIHELLGMHISSYYEAEAIAERIDEYLEQEENS